MAEATSIDGTLQVVSAYLSNNIVPQGDVPNFITSVHNTLTKIASAGADQEPVEPPTPAVPIKKSVTPDYIYCLEDGKPFRSLKRHLKAHYDMTPEQYREKWGLTKDYPMVAPNYAAQRSNLAKEMGLGRLPTDRK
jgi:predicted transcriptional regulator